MNRSVDSLALLEIGNLTPALLVADRAAKAAGVAIVAIESTGAAEQCIKLVGDAAAVRAAGEAGAELGRRMGTSVRLSVLPNPREEIDRLNRQPPQWSPMLELYDGLAPKQDPENMNESSAIGLLETQGLVAALHATDDMLKAAHVELVGKEKIGAAYVTIVIRGDVAAVQSAIATGRQTVERLGGKLIMADVVPRPHPELAKLLPKMN
ncbi:MAG: BMC domain-containing protein [Pirellulales bacterium]